MAPGMPRLCSFCPSRWTVHGASVESIQLSYEMLQATWKEAVTVACPWTWCQGPNQWRGSHHAEFQLSVWSHVGWTNSQAHWQPKPYPSTCITICSRGTIYITIVCLCPSRHADRLKFQPVLGLGTIHTEVPRYEWPCISTTAQVASTLWRGGGAAIFSTRSKAVLQANLLWISWCCHSSNHRSFC